MVSTDFLTLHRPPNTHDSHKTTVVFSQVQQCQAGSCSGPAGSRFVSVVTNWLPAASFWHLAVKRLNASPLPARTTEKESLTESLRVSAGRRKGSAAAHSRCRTAWVPLSLFAHILQCHFVSCWERLTPRPPLLSLCVCSCVAFTRRRLSCFCSTKKINVESKLLSKVCGQLCNSAANLE